ncbi:MAG: M12 family metallopeptidase [Chloroflexota bacterium]
MYDNKQRITKRHFYGILFLMVVLGTIAIWQSFKNTGEAEQPLVTPAVIDPEFGMAFNADGTPGIVMNTLYTGVLNGTYVNSMSLSYVQANGLAIYQGDIILGTSTTQNGLGIVPRSNYMWTDGIVPYTIDNNLVDKHRIYDAMAYWEEHTVIRFVERTDENSSDYPNYLRFVTSTGCASYVGMQGGAQRLFLSPRCSTGNTIHEIGHAIGLWHEHSRNDRDEYVDVRFENIYRGYEHNFQIQSNDGEDIGEYDYGSIMHYPAWAFSKNGEDTIVPLQDDVEIGQRTHMSEGDLEAVAAMYGEPETVESPFSGFTDTEYGSEFSSLGYGCYGEDH